MKTCEQFGPERANEIEALIEAATGRPCPGRCGSGCPLDPPVARRLEAVS
jgi:hypothetical protein